MFPARRGVGLLLTLLYAMRGKTTPGGRRCEANLALYYIDVPMHSYSFTNAVCKIVEEPELMSEETIPVLPAYAEAPACKPLASSRTPYLPPGAIVMSVEKYLEWERDSEIRYEYVDFYALPKDGVEILENGEIRALSGESPAHNQIAALPTCTAKSYSRLPQHNLTPGKL